MPKTPRGAAIVTASLAAMLLAAVSTKALADPAADPRLAQLEAEVQQLTAEVQDLKRAQATQIQTLAPQAVAPLTGRDPAAKPAPQRIKLTLGGFAAAETVYRSRNEEADIGSSFAKIPFANNVVGHTAELRGTARQSRLSLLAEGDIDATTRAGFYTEMDFLAGPQTGNSVESNSFSPRVRNIYGTIDWSHTHLLAGQNWSLATMNTKGLTPRSETPPPTIDGQYVVGYTWARQPQVRLTQDFADRQVWAAVSLENPQTTFATAATGTTGTSVPGLTVTTTGVPTSQFDSANTLSLNHAPDVIGKLAFEPDLGGARPVHLEAYGLYRSYYDRVSVTTALNVLNLPVGIENRDTSGGGVGFGMIWSAAPKLLDLQVSGLTGRGIGRYGSAQLPDTVVGPDGVLKPIPETMVMAGATLHANRNLDLYVFGGQDRQSSVASSNSAGHFGFGSPFATLSGCLVEGGTCTADTRLMTQVTGGFWDKVYQGDFGMIRVGVQYSYTTLTAFAGATGGAPKTNDSMVFTSFRYYPF